MPSRSPFDSRASRFLSDLARHNDRVWFTEHRDRYDELLRDPLQDLLETAQAAYGPGRIMRPNRDVRFSADKSPYRTTASLWAGAVGGVYLQVGAGGLEVGGGLYEPTRDQLRRARELIDTRPQIAARLERVVADLEGDGFEIAGPPLATAPRGYPRDHPRIALLRLRHYAALMHLPIAASEDDIRSAWSAVEPLIAWAADHVGPALEWP